VGNYLDGELDGLAREISPTGILKFEGKFKANHRHGKGKLWFDPLPNSGWIEGNWKCGVLEGDAIYYYPNGTSLKGKWEVIFSHQ
jgi:antitoxin component YwqK of YwqJK toxin-antitoxin module